MAKANLKHLASVIDQQIDRVIDGSVVVDNTLSEVKADSNNPVSGKGIAKAIEAASKSLKELGYIYKGVATPTTIPDISGGKVFYLAAQAGVYSNFDIRLFSDALTSLEWNGERWFSHRIADLVTAEEVNALLESKANKTEYYPAMAVGVADNLRGRGEATEEIFSYRPSAGASNSISEEGVATMKSIKGNTVVWNQKITNGNFTDNPNSDALPNGWINSDYYITLRATISYPSEGGIKFVFNKGNATTNNLYAKLSSFSGIVTGHKYIVSCDYSTNGISTISYPDQQFALGGPEGSANRVFLKNTDGVKSRFEVIRSFSVASNIFAIQSVRGYVEGAELWIDNLMFIDLTQMFGAGNEPATVEEFYERIPMGIDPYAYNKGELLSVNAESIVTNGFNQFNGEYAEVSPNNTYYLGGEYASIGFAEELGGTTEEIVLAEDRLYTPSTKGYIYASGANININLSHSGVRDGEYEPYEERVHEIPEIAQYFPEGMRSIGGVFDEINEHEVVQRIGQRAYAEGDNDNPAVMTDGVNTIYPLDTPVVTPMPARAINLNYTVWDWGTERAVSDVPSAPFRADIIYGFNAVDTIRMNKSDIKALLQRVAALEAKVAESEAEATAEATDI